MIRRNPGASLREIAASAGISPGTARSVQARLQAGEDPAPDGPQRSGGTARQPADNVGGATESSPNADTARLSFRNHRTSGEISNILQKLYRDPALRHSEAGRRLIQVIRTKAVDETVQVALMQESPPHSRPLLARLARYNAMIWKEIESELRKQLLLEWTFLATLLRAQITGRVCRGRVKSLAAV